jgi:hypothetical protein
MGQVYYEGLQETLHARAAPQAPPEWTPFNQARTTLLPPATLT